jgi:hypothetical protein
MRLTICKIAEYATTLANGHNSIIGYFDRIGFFEYPAPAPPAVVCVEVEAEASEAGRSLVLEGVFVDQDGNVLLRAQTEGPVPFPQDGVPPRIGWFFALGGPYEIPSPGHYRVDIFANGHLIGGERLVFHAPDQAPLGLGGE